MNLVPYSSGAPRPWYSLVLQPQPLATSSFWEKGNVRTRLRDLQDTIVIAKALQDELQVVLHSKGGNEHSEGISNASSDCSSEWLSESIKEKKISLEIQEQVSLEAANSLILRLRNQLKPFDILMNQASSWEEKSAAVKLANKIQKYKRNKRWWKKKKMRVAEMLAKERERFDQADQEADEWRAREIAKDIAKRKMEKMKQIAKSKTEEEKRRLESELELVLVVEKLQELRSIRIQKLKKQGHFLPEEDDKFFERVRAAFEEEERQAAAAADTGVAKDAIAMAEESRKSVHSGISASTDVNAGVTQSQANINEDKNGSLSIFAEAVIPEKHHLEGPSYSGAYDNIGSLPIEFYHYYHGSNTDMGTLIEVRRTWDAYIRPGGSRIPGHWVQPPPPADEVWACYVVNSK
ncbi:hypothetical protein Scep_021771 [Stephania cephalantha]|uniref:Programmed cell death protein 7 n=1 Tax=Stephania cephalantha TaxID=152367 RepID=A0AAP0F9K9_9MAGN